MEFNSIFIHFVGIENKILYERVLIFLYCIHLLIKEKF